MNQKKSAAIVNRTNNTVERPAPPANTYFPNIGYKLNPNVEIRINRTPNPIGLFFPLFKHSLPFL